MPLIIFSFNFNSNKNLNKIDDLNKYIELYFKLLENNYYENLNKEKTNENKLNSIINLKKLLINNMINTYKDMQGKRKYKKKLPIINVKFF